MSTRREARERSPEHSDGGADGEPDPWRDPLRWRPANPARSFRHAADGVSEALRTQRNLRVHFVAFALVTLLGFLCRISPLEWAIVLGVCALVLVAEMVNTALEIVVDMITREYHPGARAAKDIGAGAVLVAALGAVAVGAVVFLPRLPLVPGLLVASARPVGVVTALGALGLLLGVSARRGGLLSPHVAGAFFLAATVALLAGNALVALLAVSLAALVTHARVTARPHTVREVLSSAALGLGLAFAGTCLPLVRGTEVPPRTADDGGRTPAAMPR